MEWLHWEQNPLKKCPKNHTRQTTHDALIAVADFGDATGMTEFSEGVVFDFVLGTAEVALFLAEEVAWEIQQDPRVALIPGLVVQKAIFRLLQPCFENPKMCAKALGKDLMKTFCKLRNGDPRAWGALAPELILMPVAALKALKLTAAAAASAKTGVKGAKKVVQKAVCKVTRKGCFVAGTLILASTGSAHIEEIQVGDRVITATNEESQSSSTEVDPATWKKLTLVLQDAHDPSASVHIEMLRSTEWIEEFEAKKGARIHLALDELGIVGIATVIDVTPCPSLELGEGRVVLSTITRTAGHIYTLTLDNDEVIEVTSSHRLYSADRNDWVPVGQLALGETLKSYSGDQQVKSLELQPNAQQVYNIEVEAEHRYFVAEAQVLSHNDCPEIKGKKPPYSPNPQKWVDEKGGNVWNELDGTWVYENKDGVVVGYPDGHPDFKEAGLVRKEADIDMKGNHSTDYTDAEKIAGPRPPGTTWHHHENGTTMQAVDSGPHSDFTHKGGVSKKKNN